MNEEASGSKGRDDDVRSLSSYRDNIRALLAEAARFHWTADEIIARARRVDAEYEVERQRAGLGKAIPRAASAHELDLFGTSEPDNNNYDKNADELYPLG